MISTPSVYGIGAVNALPAILPVSPQNAEGYFMLQMLTSSLTTAHFGPFTKYGVNYRVTTGKKFKGQVLVWSASTTVTWQWAYSLTAVAFNDASITSGTFEGQAAANYGHAPEVSNRYQTIAFDVEFPSLSYPCVQVNTGANAYDIMLWGREI